MNLNNVIDHNKLQNVITQIIGHYDPLQVVLFGSQAYGVPTEDSDVDLLVVMNTPMKEVEQALHICRTVDYHFALGLIVRKPETIQRRLHLDDPFIQDIVTKGKVLYERASHRMD